MWARIWVGLVGLMLLGMPHAALGAVEPVRRGNVPRGNWSYLLETVSPSRTKAGELKVLSNIPFRWLGTQDFGRRIGVTGGESLTLSQLDEGRVVGSTGAGPCIGLILLVPAPHGLAYAVFHFSATEDPAATIGQLGRLPYGTRAALFGGDNSPSSNFTLRGVLSYLRSHSIYIEGYSDSVGLWVDSAGRYYRYRTDVDSMNE